MLQSGERTAENVQIPIISNDTALDSSPVIGLNSFDHSFSVSVIPYLRARVTQEEQLIISLIVFHR